MARSAAEGEPGRTSARTYDLERTISFSDAVIAIAITLIVLALEVPQLESPDSVGDLADELSDLLPDFFAYVLGFFVVGRFWVVHHAFFGQLTSMDGGLTALNLLFLGLIALMPFPTNLYGDYSDNALALTVFAGVLAAISVLMNAMHIYAHRTGLVREEARRELGDLVAWFSLPAVFLVAIPIAWLVSAQLAPLVWAITIPLRRWLT